MKQVLKDRLLVEKIKAKSTSTTLDIIPDENSPLTGQVIQIGKLVEDIKEGDIILYKESDSLAINIYGKNLLILREYDIIGIL